MVIFLYCRRIISLPSNYKHVCILININRRPAFVLYIMIELIILQLGLWGSRSSTWLGGVWVIYGYIVKQCYLEGVVVSIRA